MIVSVFSRRFSVLMAFIFGVSFHGGMRSAKSEDAAKLLEGSWTIELEITDELRLPILVELTPDSLDADSQSGENEWSAVIKNGTEIIPVEVEVSAEQLIFRFPHYDSKIELNARKGQTHSEVVWSGEWRKTRGAGNRETSNSENSNSENSGDSVSKHTVSNEKGRGDDGVARVKCSARRNDKPLSANGDHSPFMGRFEVRFADSEEPAVGVFQPSSDGKNLIQGTFLTTTGDYRFLWGSVSNGTMTLQCFDGGHAFLFRAKLTTSNESDRKLVGDFYSGNWYHVTWEARPNADASLPDGFGQTKLVDDFASKSLFDFRGTGLTFPNVEGKRQALNSPELFGKYTLVEVFGSWCPNCHDEAALLNQLQQKYGSKGLRVLGIAFELTGNFDRDAKQVRHYIDRHNVQYPILIAGVADKEKASQSLPWLDRIRSYPTTLFVDQAGTVQSIYTGFAGPATGEAHRQLVQRFEALIEQGLRE